MTRTFVVVVRLESLAWERVVHCLSSERTQDTIQSERDPVSFVGIDWHLYNFGVHATTVVLAHWLWVARPNMSCCIYTFYTTRKIDRVCGRTRRHTLLVFAILSIFFCSNCFLAYEGIYFIDILCIECKSLRYVLARMRCMRGKRRLDSNLNMYCFSIGVFRYILFTDYLLFFLDYAGSFWPALKIKYRFEEIIYTHS